MITPRPYQARIVDSIAKTLTKHTRVLAVAPTASGKSIIIALIVQRYLAKNPTHRVLCLCHTGEILVQNEEKLQAMGLRQTGLYCAGQGRKDVARQVTLASRDSLGRNPGVCGYFDLVLVDEAHLLSDDEESLYQRIFDCLQPRFAVGLTGTPWRLDNGLIYGKGKFWQALADSISMEEVREAGFLVPYTLPPRIKTLIDTSSVAITAGEFNNKQLTAVSITETVVKSCLDEWWTFASDRRTTLFFCCSKEHAKVVVRMLSKYTPSIAYLDGETSAKKRKDLIEMAKLGVYKAIVNVGVLTTGTDIPIIDCICFLRATQSVSLFVQMAGRALRIFPGKSDALLIDCAGNFERFGTLENPRPPRGKRNNTDESLIAQILAEEGIEMMPTQEAPQKQCPACKTKTYAAATRCNECGHVFFNHNDVAISADDLAGANIFRLASIISSESQTRKGVPCLIIEYRTECGKDFKEWLFHKTAGFHKWQASQKLAALQRGATHIRVDQSQEFPKVYPLNLQSKGSFSPICLQSDSSSGDKTTAAYGTP